MRNVLQIIIIYIFYILGFLISCLLFSSSMLLKRKRTVSVERRISHDLYSKNAHNLCKEHIKEEREVNEGVCMFFFGKKKRIEVKTARK